MFSVDSKNKGFGLALPTFLEGSVNAADAYIHFQSFGALLIKMNTLVCGFKRSITAPSFRSLIVILIVRDERLCDTLGSVLL